MKKIAGLVAALGMAVAATSASAAITNFQGDYDVTLNTSDPGLVVNYTPITSDVNGLNFNLDVGNTTSIDLFKLYTPEGSINGDDLVSEPIQVAFNFTLPAAFGGAVDGTTQGNGVWTFFGYVLDNGTVTWNGGGSQILSFGSGGSGKLLVDLNDAVFSSGLTDLNQIVKSATISADFTYLAAPVPEPATWAMMLVGFFGMGSVVRAQRRRGLIATAA